MSQLVGGSPGTPAPPPRFFVWTRYGSEGGQGAQEIFARKERERVAGGGIFLWGIGNSLRPSVPSLLRKDVPPLVLFSPMASRPQARDASPAALVRWTRAVTPVGARFELPDCALVTSRRLRPGRYHYALVCRSAEPLVPVECCRIEFGCMRNILSGAPIGASQTTATVEYASSGDSGSRSYPVTLVAELAPPYFLILLDPRTFDPEDYG